MNRAPWSSAPGQYAFLDELAALRPRIRGAGNQARFDRWMKSFEYLRAIGRVACTRGAPDRVMAALTKKPDAAAKKESAPETALPARVELPNAWRQMMTLCLETAATWGTIGGVYTHEMSNRRQMGLLEGHGRALTAALGSNRPEGLRPDRTCHGTPRLIVPTVRSLADRGESLTLKILALDQRPVKSVAVHVRPLGQGEWRKSRATHIARAMSEAKLPAAWDGFEDYVAAETATAARLGWPATAPERNQTVVTLQP